MGSEVDAEQTTQRVGALSTEGVWSGRFDGSGSRKRGEFGGIPSADRTSRGVSMMDLYRYSRSKSSEVEVNSSGKFWEGSISKAAKFGFAGGMHKN